LDRLEQVSLEDIARVQQAYLRPANRTTGLYLPSGNGTA
jgi:predicted Zn-dependent peptidase